MTKHNYDDLRIKTLLGIDVDVVKHDTYASLAKMILKHQKKVENHVNEGFRTNQNSLILLAECGFVFKETNNKYDMIYDDVYLNLRLPQQSYYTHLLLKPLRELKKPYFEKAFINIEHIEIEKSVINNTSESTGKRKLDICITSIDKKYAICVEINEYAHRTKIREDLARCSDLLVKYNENDIRIVNIFVLRLNKNNKVDISEIDKITKDMLEAIKKINSIGNRKKYVVDYLVSHNIGNKQFCNLLYDSNYNNIYVKLSDIVACVKSKLKPDISKEIYSKFKKYHNDYVEDMKKSSSHKKACSIFDDSEDDNDENEEDDNDSDDDNDKKITELENRVKYKKDGTEVNFIGINWFLSFLAENRAFFININGHNFVKQYFLNCTKCMMMAIDEIANNAEKFVEQKKPKFYGKYNCNQ